MTDQPQTAADKRVIQCNFCEATSECSEGARAYLMQNLWGRDRVRILARSRSGRWIDKWESARRLNYFRTKTMPASHPLYEMVPEIIYTDDHLRQWNEELDSRRKKRPSFNN
jgi:hypothetical protein